MDTLTVRSHIDDTENRGGNSALGKEAFEEGVYAQVVGTNFRSGGVEANNPFFGVDFSEHSDHFFKVVMV